MTPEAIDKAMDLITCSHSSSLYGPCWNCAKRMARAVVEQATAALQEENRNLRVRVKTLEDLLEQVRQHGW